MRTREGLFFLLIACILLSGCVGSIISGASMVYDRHNLYKKMDDVQLAGRINQSLFRDGLLRQPGCSLDLSVFNGDVLLAGHVPTAKLRRLAKERVIAAADHRRLFLQIRLSAAPGNSIEDGWITMKIRSQIIGDSQINPHKFKVVTVDRVVYLMGDVIPAQARRVIDIARDTAGVRRVVKLFKYFNLSDKPFSGK